MKYHVKAGYPADTISSLPKIGEPYPDYGMKIIQYEVSSVPRSFWDWLFRRPPLWEVNVTFESQDSSR